MKLLKLATIIIISCMLSGCWIYGEGRTVGYITTVEDGIFWDTVWIRADVTSSQTNGYAIRKSKETLRKELLKTSEEYQKVELHFKKHIFMARSLSQDVLSDEIVGYKLTTPRD